LWVNGSSAQGNTADVTLLIGIALLMALTGEWTIDLVLVILALASTILFISWIVMAVTTVRDSDDNQ